MQEPKLEKEFKFKWGLGPAAGIMIPALLRKFQATIKIVYKDKTVADMMEVLTLSIDDDEPPKNVGHMANLRIKFIIQGPEAATAMAELTEFFTRGARADARRVMLEKEGLEKEFELKWRLGLLAAKMISRLVHRFRVTIKIVYKDKTINVRDSMEVVRLDTIDYEPANLLEELGLMAGSRIKLIIQGPDYVVAMEELTEFFTCGPRLDRCPVAGCPSTLAPVYYWHDVIVYECERGHLWEIDRTRPVEKQTLQPSEFMIYGKPSFDKDFPNKA